jgi:hypothetical protein
LKTEFNSTQASYKYKNQYSFIIKLKGDTQLKYAFSSPVFFYLPTTTKQPNAKYFGTQFAYKVNSNQANKVEETLPLLIHARSSLPTN